MTRTKKTHLHLHLLHLLLLAASVSLPAQNIVRLVNPSFEGKPQDATVPMGWHKCAHGSTPDILPGVWGVYTEAAEGETYMGLITRSDGSYESIGQRLSTALPVGECYRFSIDLAHSGAYAGHNKPIKLRIWGADRKCRKTQLLLETDLVKHRQWKTYPARFTVEDRAIHYIILEAYYSDEPFSVEGNILLDNMTPIRLCPRA